jgi:hypothetical protein
VLAVDTARSSGWCITIGGAYHSSGQCDAFGPAPREICVRVINLSPKAQLVLERPFGGSTATLVGLGAARGCWESSWREATGGKTLVRCKSVYPQVWRSQLFGSTASFALQERLTAQLVTRKTDVGADEAAAVCIARWAERELEKNAARKSAVRTRSASHG